LDKEPFIKGKKDSKSRKTPIKPSFFFSLNIFTNPTMHQWLAPVILATQEVEIRKITVRSQAGQIVLKTLS
jgi:hypothetical protein